jgi:alpha-galactosidase
MDARPPMFFADEARLSGAGIVFSGLSPLLDGVAPSCSAPRVAPTETGWTITWTIDADRGRSVVLSIAPVTLTDGGDAFLLDIALEGVGATPIDAFGLRIGDVANVVRYLRNGYTSWDGSYFVELDSARGIVEADRRALIGHAMTALISRTGEAAVLGFVRHDRFQSRFRFAFSAGPLTLDIESLLDGASHADRVTAEPLLLLTGVDVEETLRCWARHVAEASPYPPRTPERRIVGWCSWYSLYSSINEQLILEHLAAARRFRDRYRVAFDVFQIDDGFTPEMGDWLEVKPQFPRGMKPLLADIRAAGFAAGLWIAPFMVGNRSRLYAEHPDWVVTDRLSGKPLAPMTFYGEFRWHKRSEEYYVLDITHPRAEAYLREVFRIWRRDWGCEYFKTDFMYFGSEYGPHEARWRIEGLSRMEIWMRMARLIREEIGDALWLGCGGPIWAPIGLVDAVRIGRDVGVTWKGRYSAESLLRDQTSRNFANGILWQSDPDCILLRERFHELTNEQVRSLALFAGLTGGVLMTSDQLDEVSETRRELLAWLADDGKVRSCDFPLLGQSALRHRMGAAPNGAPMLIAEGDPVLVQRVRRADGALMIVLLNTGDAPTDRLIDRKLTGTTRKVRIESVDASTRLVRTSEGVHVSLPPYTARALLFAPE